MTLLDAYALIALFGGEEAAGEVTRILRRGGTKVVVTNITETFDRAMRVHGVSWSAVNDLVDRLKRVQRLSVVPLDEPIARRAGQLRATKYHRVRLPISLADCVAAATAESLSEPIATPDVHLAELSREIGVDVIALPDSSGRRP